MKIAIVGPSPVPFTRGGAERLHNSLRQAIEDWSGHEAELIKVPSPEHDLPALMASYERFAALDLSHFDAVISLKYPGWMAGHERHISYLTHRLRGLYDTYHLTGLPTEPDFGPRALRGLARALASSGGRERLPTIFGEWDSALARLGANHPAFAFPGPLARALVHTLDDIAFAPASMCRYAAISRTVAERPGYFPQGANVDAIVPPSAAPPVDARGSDFFFTASRLDRPKRLDLVVAAMSHVHAAISLKIAGTGPELEVLRAAAATDPRIQLLGYVPEEELGELYADALAVPFVPLDEDLGYITLEAMAAGKPVVTCTDSGGPTEFVVDEVNGFICAPDPAALGRALERLATEPGLAARLGAAGKQRVSTITWEAAVDQLLDPVLAPSGPRSGPAPPLGRTGPVDGHPAQAPQRRPGLPKVVVTSTFAIHPPVGGGQLRSFHLYRSLTPWFDVEVVSIAGPEAGPERRSEIAPGLTETVVRRSAQHDAEEAVITAAAELPVTDIVTGSLIHLTPAYVDALRRAADDADVVLLSHPYLLPAVDVAGLALPLVYDAHNVEVVLKEAVLPPSKVRDELLASVRTTEGDAVTRAVLTAGCSAEDLALLRDRYGADPERQVLIPNGVDVRGVPFTPGPIRAEMRERWLSSFRSLRPGHPAQRLAIFLGSWHPPNLEAARDIHRMAKELDEVLFLMGGSHCMQFSASSVPNNVALLGVVSDDAKLTLLAAADVALNPMRQGSGTNLKLVEYFAAGTPVVSTPLGVRGLDVLDREHCAIGPVDAFPRLIRSVIDDPATSANAAVRARQLVEEAFDWETLGERLAHQIAARCGLVSAVTAAT